MDRCTKIETTFAELEADERFKKLQNSLRLAEQKKNYNKNIYNMEGSPMTTWSSMSSINVENTMDTNCVTSSSNCMMSNSFVKSEVLAFSNNLRKVLLKNKSHNTNQKAMITSSVKNYNTKQENHLDHLVMPPPVGSRVYRMNKKIEDKIYDSSNCDNAELIVLNNSVQSLPTSSISLKSTSSQISANANTDKEHLASCISPMTPNNETHKTDRVFSRWKVMLNDQYELIIKGTLECGKIARSKSIIRRYTATCIESKFRHKYRLEGNIVDERYELPDYVRGKFYNGFPDDWENVYQIWRTYVNKGCPMTFRWPTPITDSDDDLKSEATDLIYTSVGNKKEINRAVPATESCKPAEYTHKSEHSSNKSPRMEIGHNIPSYEKNASVTKPLDSENTILTAQTTNAKLTCDEGNKQDTSSSTNSSFIFWAMNKLKYVLQENILNIIFQNLENTNCSPTYVQQIFETIHCIDNIITYRAEAERSHDDAMVSTNRETSKSEAIPPQQIILHSNNSVNTATRPENRTMELKSCVHSTDLGYESIKNDFVATQQSNSISVQPQHDDGQDSGESESEIYAGVPKISMERVLKSREAYEKIYRRKRRKRTICPEVAGLQRDAKEAEPESVRATIPVTSTEKHSTKSVTKMDDEAEATNADVGRKMAVVAERPQRTSFSSHQEVPRSNINTHGGDESARRMQNQQQCDAFDKPSVNVNVLTKEQRKHRVAEPPQQKMRAQLIPDVDYTSCSEIDVVTVNREARKIGGNMGSRTNSDQDVVICSSESNFSAKPHVPRKQCREFIEQPKSEPATKRSKPTIISSVPVNLNLKISKANLTPAQPDDLDITILCEEEDQQRASIRSTEEARKKKPVSQMPVTLKPAIVTSVSKTTTRNNNKKIDDKKEVIHTIKNNNKESETVSSTNSTTTPTTGQSKSSKLGVENKPNVLTAWMPKVVHYAKSKSKLGLIFQGKLLNDAGHVMQRNFTTAVILTRISDTLIETVNHEFYELLGNLNDNKHNIPKELAQQCRKGCPAKIQQFCLTWQNLQHVEVQNVADKLHDTSVDSLNTPVSSRGRRILPPLSYWTGERVSLKDNTPVYSPGNLLESSITSLLKNNSKENIGKTVILEKTRSPIKQSNKSSKIRTPTTTKSDSRKSRRSTANRKRQITQLKSSSSDLSTEEEKVSPRKRSRSSPPKAEASTDTEAETPRYALRMRTKKELSPIRRRSSARLLRNNSYENAAKLESQLTNHPTKTAGNVMYTYYKGIALSENLLSEDQVSPA